MFLIFRREFDSILDGIVYAGIVALGFASTENVYYIYEYGYVEGGTEGLIWLVFVRVFLVGWQHPFYTSFIGIGLATTRISRNKLAKFIAPLLGWTAAVFTHSVHNTLASLLSGATGLIFGTVLDWGGWFIMFLVILWAIFREQRNISNQLQEEAKLGVITPAQYRTASSALAQSRARVSALTSGRYHATHRFYQACAELAYKKQQRSTHGEERDNTVIIERLRAELARLAPQVRS